MAQGEARRPKAREAFSPPRPAPKGDTCALQTYRANTSDTAFLCQSYTGYAVHKHEGKRDNEWEYREAPRVVQLDIISSPGERICSISPVAPSLRSTTNSIYRFRQEHPAATAQRSSGELLFGKSTRPHLVVILFAWSRDTR